MTKTCIGCGAVLQSSDPHSAGYTPKEGSDYCQRCFRLIHYDDLTVSMKTGIDPDLIFEEIARTDGILLYVADLFDFEACLIPGLTRKAGNRDIVLVCTKRDLLPDTVSHDKIAQFVFGRLKEYGISIRELVLVSSKDGEGIDEVKAAVSKYADHRPVIVMGRANSGKSTLLNALLGKKVLTSSRYPGTTLGFNELEAGGIRYIDTPGIEMSRSMIMAVKEEDLKVIMPVRTIKPKVYQIHEDQSFSIGGMARVDVSCPTSGTVAWYLSDQVYLHRSKKRSADELWEKQYGKLLVPTVVKNDFTYVTHRKKEEKIDVAIDGLGWCCISGDITDIGVKIPKDVSVTFRKAML
ncbi:MAG: ribosome biogenesis GTPase YqeH [Solobacterium sp.]|nr:ribosome biogenesis GTPase YqeH [Solobacterium sp.]